MTLAFIPLEIYKLCRHVTAPGIITLALNVASVVYLIVRLKLDSPRNDVSRHRRMPAAAPAQPA